MVIANWISTQYYLIIRMLCISWLWASFEFKSPIISTMPLFKKFIEFRNLSVSFGRLLGKTLLLFNKVHWLAKNISKSSASSLNLGANLFSWKSGGIQGIFLSFRNVFKIDQYVFELVKRLANLLDSLKFYLCLHSSIDIFNWFCRAFNFSKRNTSLLKRHHD